MAKAHLYRLQQIYEIGKESHEEKIKQGLIIQRYHCIINFCDTCFVVVQFCMFLLNVGFLFNFQEIVGKVSGMILQGLNLLFGAFSIFLKVIQKRFFKKFRNMRRKNTG